MRAMKLGMTLATFKGWSRVLGEATLCGIKHIVEALRFMWTDQTDEHMYMENYTCLNFAADFKENAFEAGYRCGFVYLKFSEGAHALVCFNTTSRGIVFIEPQFDVIVRVEVGVRYWVDNGFQCLDCDDIIIDFVIIW